MFAVVMSLVGAFYYLRVVKTMYFDNKADESPINSDSLTAVLLSFNAIMLLIWGVFPSQLMNFIQIVLKNSGF